MSSSAETANELVVRAAGRNPQWVTQADASPTEWSRPPAAESAGVDLDNAVVALVKVGLREAVQHRRARITVTSFDGSANYTVTINGTAIATTAGSFADVDAVLVAMAAKIAADATVGGAAGANQVVSSELLDSAGAVTSGTAAGGNAAVTLRVFGYDGTNPLTTDYSVAISATGTGVLACDADPVSATLHLFWQGKTSGSNSPTGCVWEAGKTSYSLTGFGFYERFDVGGLQKGHAYLASIAGHGSDGASVTYNDSPTVNFGPGAAE